MVHVILYLVSAVFLILQIDLSIDSFFIVLINLGIVLFLVHKSSDITSSKSTEDDSSLVNMILTSTLLAFLMALTVTMIHKGPENLTIFIERMVLVVLSFLYLLLSCYFLSYIFKDNDKLFNICKIVGVLISLFFVFTKIKIVDYTTCTFGADRIFSGQFGEQFKLTWLGLFYAIYIFILPGLSLLFTMLYAENRNSRLFFQRGVFFAGALLFSWVGLTAIALLSTLIPVIAMCFMLVIVVTMNFVAQTAMQAKIYDAFSIISNLFFNFIRYAVPAFLGAFVFVLLRPTLGDTPVLYLPAVFVIVAVVVFGSYWLEKLTEKLSIFRSSQYGKAFEADLAAIDYDDETLDICSRFYKLFQKRVNVDQMKVLIAVGNDELNTVFASDGFNVTRSIKDPGLEAVRDEGITILIKDELKSIFALQQNEAQIMEFFKALSAEAIIILNEGRHLLGVIALGRKRGGSSYDEYDKEVFDKLYSYFFVFGYYLSNISNASVVGTVNREIKMSAQIIKSIQENMDLLNNPKIDVGYLMVPAHNIGGEFVDLVRLSPTRHILVTGAMSGKGISASMNMVILKSIMRTLISTTKDFKKFVARVNEFIRFNLPKGSFFAGVFCMVDFETDTLYYINCGIPTMLLYTRSFNNVIEIQGNGFVLGFAKDITPLLRVKQMKLNPGDVLAITTSGVINSHSLRGDQYGKDNIKKSMTDNYMYDAMHMATFLFDDLKKFMAKELDDDITVMMIRYLDKDTQTVTSVDGEEEKKEEPVVEEKPAGPIVLEAL